jgi:hypothetical protein
MPPAPQSPSAANPAPDSRTPRIAKLVAEVYEASPPGERGRLLEPLLRPLGLLSLLAVANGVFAKALFRGGWPEFRLAPDDIRGIRGDHVIALVDFAQQVSVSAVDGLADALAASPVLSGSAAAALLLGLLLQRAGLPPTGDRAVH